MAFNITPYYDSAHWVWNPSTDPPFPGSAPVSQAEPLISNNKWRYRKLSVIISFGALAPWGGGGGGVLGSGFAGYVPLASQNPYPIIVYSVANCRPHLSHFWANVIVISRTEFNASRMLNVKTTAGTIFQLRIFLFLNLCLPEFSYPRNPETLRPHSSNSTKNVTPL